MWLKMIPVSFKTLINQKVFVIVYWTDLAQVFIKGVLRVYLEFKISRKHKSQKIYRWCLNVWPKTNFKAELRFFSSRLSCSERVNCFSKWCVFARNASSLSKKYHIVWPNLTIHSFIASYFLLNCLLRTLNVKKGVWKMTWSDVPRCAVFTALLLLLNFIHHVAHLHR